MEHSKSAMFIIYALFLVLVSIDADAVECGNVPTDGCTISNDTTFVPGTYELSTGVSIIASGIVLDCNTSILRGWANGIQIIGSFNSNTMKNCNFENYTIGIRIDGGSSNIIEDDTFTDIGTGVQILGVPARNNIIQSSFFENVTLGVSLLSEHSQVKDNTFIDGSNVGVSIAGPDVKTNNVTGNHIAGYGVHSILLDDQGFDNNIWNNTINDTNLTYTLTSNTHYCINDIPNTYNNGAQGPTNCSCLPLVNDLEINSDETYCVNFYELLNGIEVIEGGVTVDLSGITINGSSSAIGILLRDGDFSGPNSVTVKNANINNYLQGIQIFRGNDNIMQNNTIFGSSEGIRIRGTGSQGIRNNIAGHTFNNNTEGIVLDIAYHNIIQNNTIANGTEGISHETGSQNNTFNNNLFKNNARSFFNDATANVSAENNCWEQGIRSLIPAQIFDFDDDNTKGIVDFEPFLVNSQCAGAAITDLIPIQVIRDVPLIKGKTTLIRVNVAYGENITNQTTINTTVYVNGTFLGSNLTVFNGTEEKPIDFQIGGTDFNYEGNLTFNATITTDTPSYNDTQEKNTTVNVTTSLNVIFIPMDEKTTGYDEIVENSTEFLTATYPIADNNLFFDGNNPLFNATEIVGDVLDADERITLLKMLERKNKISGSTSFTVGIVPPQWFFSKGLNNTFGYAQRPPTIGPFKFSPLQAVVVEEGYRHTVAHEIGHPFGLCDEYDSDVWDSQNSKLTCPNGDVNGDGSLDLTCINEAPLGCKTETFGQLIPFLDSQVVEKDLGNFMGGALQDTFRWVTNETFIHLLGKLVTDGENPESTPSKQSLVISGDIFKNGTIALDDVYIIEKETSITQETFGNYTITLSENNSIISEFEFTPSFEISDIGGELIETNNTAFVFLLPLPENTTNLRVKENNITKKQVNRSASTPQISSTSIIESQVISQFFNVSWNATDTDNDTLHYSILISADSGLNFTTFVVDTNKSSFQKNFSEIGKGKNYVIKILATDGFNTNFTITDEFCISDGFSICGLKKLSLNQTVAIFEFKLQNNLQNNLEDINWTLETGDNNTLRSNIPINLTEKESVFVYVEYEYSQNGSYTLTATGNAGNVTDHQKINITV